jgi:hypothetical protein
MDLPELEHEFTERAPDLVHDGYAGKDVGDGSVSCSRCGLVLPTEGGEISPDWRRFVQGISCAERLVDLVDAL